MKLILLITALVLLPTAAAADPISAAIAKITASTFGSFLFKTALSLGLSLLSQVLFRPDEPGRPDRGVNIRQTGSGGDAGQRFIMGRYATGGQLLAPPLTGPNASETQPNSRLHYVVAISCIPGVTFRRWWIDGQEAEFTGDSADTGGDTYDHRGESGVSLTWRDDESEAPQYLLDLPLEKRPWQSDMIGKGITYALAVFYFRYDQYRGKPSVRFEVDGIPLLDPRDGVTRQTDNPVIMIWNILRGIEIPGGENDPDVWGYGVDADDLPDSVWFAAMNECDVQVDDGEGGTVPQYRAGIEVDVVDDEPAEVIDRLLNACAGQIVEMGGRWRIRVGGPGAPVLFITDEDIVITESSDFEPFPGLQQTHNALHASYPEPDAAWEPKDAPPRYNADYEADDDGRRLVASIEMPAVWDKSQVQRLMISYIEEERRFRRHLITLPPAGAVLEPLDSIAWTSERNFYDEKVFEVSAIEDNLATLAQGVALRERDPDDYDPPQDYFVPTPITPPEPEPIPVQGVPGWGVQAVAIKDGEDNERRPDIRLTWFGFDPNDSEGGPGDDIQALNWEVRLAGGDLVAKGSTEDIPAGELLVGSSALVADTVYEARGRYRAPGRPTEWTAWTPVNTGDIRLTEADLSEQIRQKLQEGEAAVDIARESNRRAIDVARRVRDAEDDLDLETQVSIESLLKADGNSASITTLKLTKVDADGALAAINTEISAQYGDIAALAQATAFAEATAEGVLEGFIWSLGDDDVLKIVRADDGEEVVTTATISTDYILLDGTVTVTGSFFTDVLAAESAWIKSAMIADAEVSRAKIQNAAINTAKIDELKSQDYIEGEQGYFIDADRAEFGTLEIRENAISVMRVVNNAGPWENTSYTTVASVDFTPSPEADALLITATGFLELSCSNLDIDASAEAEMRADINIRTSTSGPTVSARQFFQEERRQQSRTHIFTYADSAVVENPTGSQTPIQVRFRNSSEVLNASGNAVARLSDVTLSVLEIKR